ncbi:MAG: hypothetical protein IJX85_07320 [Lachnospiraceae bacterium]|nr:hypothetical protein [Lachnospiraceae bacterium]
MLGRKLQTIFLKNTFAVVGPAIAVFLVLSILLLRYPALDKLECEDITGVADYSGRLQVMYESDTRLVEYDAKNLYYTGYDYYVDDELAGAYYYSTENGYMDLFIIETDHPESFIEAHHVKGEIIMDNISVNHIVSKLAAAAGIKQELVESYYSKYVISELDYPTGYIAMMYVLCLAPAVLCALLLLYVLLVFINPAMHSQAAQLSVYGDVRQVIRDINYELKKKLLYKRENVYITNNFMIVSYMLKTEVIKLDMIRYMSKNIVDKKVGLKKEIEVYRLTISDPGVLFYEIDFLDESFIDEVVKNIRGI